MESKSDSGKLVDVVSRTSAIDVVMWSETTTGGEETPALQTEGALSLSPRSRRRRRP